MKEKELMVFVRSLWDRGLLTKSPDEFDYERVIWDYLKLPNPAVSDSVQAESIEFAEWIRTFDSLEKKQGFWIIESQISSEELYKLSLEDRDRWRNERTKLRLYNCCQQRQ